MAEIIFDAFHPKEGCRHSPSAQVQDTCRIGAKFHVRGENTPPNAFLNFKRDRDRFVLETAGNESLTALARGLGLSETHPVLQGKLFYSIAIHDWLKSSQEGWLNKAQGRELQHYLPVYSSLRNFIVTGSIENPDPEQRRENAELLESLFRVPFT